MGNGDQNEKKSQKCRLTFASGAL